MSEAVRYPDIFVAVADGAPRGEIIARVANALPSKAWPEFRDCVPSGYAMTVDYIREWCSTD